MKILLIIGLSFIILWALFTTIVVICSNMFLSKTKERMEDIALNGLLGIAMFCFICFLIKLIIDIL
jgi:uncharacterized membrane protein YccC